MITTDQHHSPSPADLDWNRAMPEKLPRPTYWPAMLGFGLTLALLGPVTSMWLSLVGLIFAGFALVGWIGDLLHE